jgi:hypothetical protein
MVEKVDPAGLETTTPRSVHLLPGALGSSVGEVMRPIAPALLAEYIA